MIHTEISNKALTKKRVFLIRNNKNIQTNPELKDSDKDRFLSPTRKLPCLLSTPPVNSSKNLRALSQQRKRSSIN